MRPNKEPYLLAEVIISVLILLMVGQRLS